MYDPDTEESGGLLTIQGHQFFGGRFVDQTSGEFKITSYPSLSQEAPTEETPEALPAAPLPGNYKLVA
ncbi:secretion and cellular translocation Q domain protein, partial [Chlamydia psittaci 84-8471/1]